MASKLIIDGETIHGSVNSAASIICKDVEGNDSTVQAELSNLINYIYPIGSIYMSVNEVSPAAFIGGTWEKIENRFLLAAGSDYATGSTGGEASHVLTIDEMPSHKHYLRLTKSNVASGSNYARLSSTGDWNDQNLVTDEGNNQPHNNMPPYLAVNIWKRVA